MAKQFVIGIKSRKLPENIRRNSKEGKQCKFNEKQLAKTRAALKRVVIIELIFILTFLPFIVSTIQERFCKKDRRSVVNKIYFISTFLVCTGCFSNVFVYQFMWNDFRKRLQAIFSDYLREEKPEKRRDINGKNKIEGPSISCETQV